MTPDDQLRRTPATTEAHCQIECILIQMSIVGQNFPIVTKAALLSAAPPGGAPSAAIPTKPTHVVIAPATVRDAGDGKARAVTELAVGMQVVLVETAQGWALVARDGKKLGWIELSKLVRPQ